MTRPSTRDLRARSVLAGEARRLGLTGALGTVAAERDGFYTGELVGDLLHGPAKAEAVLSDWTEGGTPRVVDSGCFSSKPRCCLGRNGDS